MHQVVTARLSRDSQAFIERAAEALRLGARPAVLACSADLRLPSAFLAGEIAHAGAAGWRLDGAGERTAAALVLLGLGARFSVQAPDSYRTFLSDPPFRVRLDQDGVLRVTPVLGAAGNPRLESSSSHTWVAALALPSVVIDLAHITHLNSVLIAWMLQVAQHARPAPVRIANAAPSVTAQLRQLRLDHLMTLI